MPRVGFEPENKVATTNYDFPKLKLKKGEFARVLAGLENPLVEFVHNLRKPLVINGVPQMETKQRKDKSEYEANKTDFVGSPICLGDYEVLKVKGSDLKNCPACQAAKDHPDYFAEPKRRYAMHVVRYRTKPGSTDIATPFSVELLVWAYGDKVYNKLNDAKNEWTDLRQHDLLLGPCTVENYQQFDIAVSRTAEWAADDARKALTVATFRENQIPDLAIAIGSVKRREWIEQDIAQVLEAWKEVDDYNAATGPKAANLSEGLDSLFSSVSGGGESTELPPAPDGFGDLNVTDDMVDPITGEFLPVSGGSGAGESTEDMLASFAPAASEEEPAFDMSDFDAAATDGKAQAQATAAKPAPAAPAANPVDNFADLLSEAGL